MKFENRSFASAEEARLLAAQGQREIAQAIAAFFLRLFTRKKPAPSEAARNISDNLVLH
jgi:hypothetical protein